jgi:hypothetical protein
MPDHKTEDYKQSAVDYYLVGDKYTRRSMSNFQMFC